MWQPGALPEDQETSLKHFSPKLDVRYPLESRQKSSLCTYVVVGASLELSWRLARAKQELGQNLATVQVLVELSDLGGRHEGSSCHISVSASALLTKRGEQTRIGLSAGPIFQSRLLAHGLGGAASPTCFTSHLSPLPSPPGARRWRKGVRAQRTMYGLIGTVSEKKSPSSGRFTLKVALFKPRF